MRTLRLGLVECLRSGSAILRRAMWEKWSRTASAADRVLVVRNDPVNSSVNAMSVSLLHSRTNKVV